MLEGMALATRVVGTICAGVIAMANVGPIFRLDSRAAPCARGAVAHRADRYRQGWFDKCNRLSLDANFAKSR